MRSIITIVRTTQKSNSLFKIHLVTLFNLQDKIERFKLYIDNAIIRYKYLSRFLSWFKEETKVHELLKKTMLIKME